MLGFDIMQLASMVTSLVGLITIWFYSVYFLLVMWHRIVDARRRGRRARALSAHLGVRVESMWASSPTSRRSTCALTSVKALRGRVIHGSMDGRLSSPECLSGPVSVPGPRERS